MVDKEHFASTESRDWTSLANHENGNYECRCVNCNSAFVGHKRMHVCRKCCSDSTMSDMKIDVVVVETPESFAQIKQIGFNKVAYYGPRDLTGAVKTEYPYYDSSYSADGVVFYSELEDYLKSPGFPTTLDELHLAGNISIFEKFFIIPKAVNYNPPTIDGYIFYINHHGDVKKTGFHLFNGITGTDFAKVFAKALLEEHVLKCVVENLSSRVQDPMFEITNVEFDTTATGLKS